MSTKWFPLALLVALTVLFSAGCMRTVAPGLDDVDEHRIARAEVHAWLAMADGSIKIPQGRIVHVNYQEGGTDLDLDNDLGLDDGEGIWGATVELNLGDRHRVYGNYDRLHTEGDELVDTPFLYKGIMFAWGTVESELDVQVASVRYGFDIADQRQEAIEAVVGVGVYLMDFDIMVKSYNITTLYEESTGEREWIPVGMFRGQAVLNSTVGLAGGVQAGTTGDSWVVDADGGVRIHLIDRVELSAGYRVLLTTLEVDGNDLDGLFHGPFFGLGFRF